MKKLVAYVLIFAFCLSFFGCSVEGEKLKEESSVPEVPEQEAVEEQEIIEEHKEKVYEYIPAKEIDYFELQAEINAERKAVIETEGVFEGFEQYLVEDPSAKGIITKEEIKELRREKTIKDTITAEEAREDVDLFFRALKYGYGAYYYFGGDETFYNAKEEVMSFTEGKDIIYVNELKEKLLCALSFVYDAHFQIGWTSPVDFDGRRYEYYYCVNHEFSKDENGFYKETVDGEKWYFSGCENPYVSIKPTLTDEGKIIYSLVLFCVGHEAKTEDVFILSKGTESREEKAEWILSREKKFDKFFDTIENQTLFNYSENENIAYIALRSCELEQNGLYSSFIKTAEKAKTKDIIIIDIRSNHGGADQFGKDWVNVFSGRNPKLNWIYSLRHNALLEGEGYYNYEWYESSKVKGKIISNDVPIYVLVDDLCGSAGESLLLMLETMENVIVIGSNSSGYQLCGNAFERYLKNSGLSVCFGASFQFKFDMTNVDGKGYEPDVWCNPETELDALFALLENKGIENRDLYEMIMEEEEIIQEEKVPEEEGVILLHWDEYVIKPNEGFGFTGGTAEIKVFCGNEPISDFTIQNENDEVCVCKKGEGNILYITALNKGESQIKISTESGTATFVFTKSE